MNKKQVAAVAILAAAGFAVGRYSRTGRHEPSAASVTPRHILYYVDPMHPSYRSSKPGKAPDCGMDLEAVFADDTAGILRAAAPEGTVEIDGAMRQVLGIQVSAVEKASASQNVRLLGRVVPDETRVFRVDSGTEGFIRDTYNDSVGTLVKKNEKLASCYGPEYLAVASGYLAAIAGVTGANGKDGSRTMPHPGTLSKQGVSSLQGYSDRLRNLGMSEAQINEMEQKRQLPESVDIVSPTDGFVIARSVTPGQHFDRSMEFYRIADLSRVWIMADVYADEAKTLAPGSRVKVTVRELSKTLYATVSSTPPLFDPASRTLKVRLEAENPGLVLRPDMFVDLELSSKAPAGISIPQDAVIDSGRQKLVYVESSDDVFEPRAIETGSVFGDRISVVRGLAEGDRVVTAGNFLIDSESRMRTNARMTTTTPSPEAHHAKEQPAPKFAEQKMSSAMHEGRGGDD